MKSKLTLFRAKFGRGMKQQRGARIVALSLALAALLAAGLTFIRRPLVAAADEECCRRPSCLLPTIHEITAG